MEVDGEPKRARNAIAVGLVVALLEHLGHLVLFLAEFLEDRRAEPAGAGLGGGHQD